MWLGATTLRALKFVLIALAILLLVSTLPLFILRLVLTGLALVAMLATAKGRHR